MPKKVLALQTLIGRGCLCQWVKASPQLWQQTGDGDQPFVLQRCKGQPERIRSQPLRHRRKGQRAFNRITTGRRDEGMIFRHPIQEILIEASLPDPGLPLDDR